MSPGLVSILAEIAACQARVAGYQAENASRMRRNEALAYTEDMFEMESDRLRVLAEAALREGGS